MHSVIINYIRTKQNRSRCVIGLKLFWVIRLSLFRMIRKHTCSPEYLPCCQWCQVITCTCDGALDACWTVVNHCIWVRLQTTTPLAQIITSLVVILNLLRSEFAEMKQCSWSHEEYIPCNIIVVHWEWSVEFIYSFTNCIVHRNVISHLFPTFSETYSWLE